MKLMVPVKRVLDPNLKARLRADGQGVELAGQKMAMNPYDEVALEESIRLRERGCASEVVVVSCGDRSSEDTLRHALALGADRAILVEVAQPLQALAVARVLRKIVEREKPAIVLCGKQAIDDDAGQVGPMLAAMLGWPQACFATQIEADKGTVQLSVAAEGGEERLALALPAVLTVELHLNIPRFASLANVMKARRVVIETIQASALGLDLAPRLLVDQYRAPPSRPPGQRLDSVEALLDCLRARGVLENREGA